MLKFVFNGLSVLLGLQFALLIIIILINAVIPFDQGGDLYKFVSLFVLLLIANMVICCFFLFFLGRAYKIKELNQSLDTKISLKDMFAVIQEQSASLELDEADEEYALKLLRSANTQTILALVLCFFGVTAGFLILPFFGFPVGIWLAFHARNKLPEAKAWFIYTAVRRVSASAIYRVSKELYSELYITSLLNKLFVENVTVSDVTILDFYTFTYKKRDVALINFYTGALNQDDSKQYYSCLLSTYPDYVEGTTLAWSGRLLPIKLSNLEFDETLSTESSEFNRLFKTLATDQVSARMHLKTNVMQDMIDLAKQKESIFYFHNSSVAVITKVPRDYVEFSQIGSADTVTQDFKHATDATLASALKIFDDFWLDRKAR